MKFLKLFDSYHNKDVYQRKKEWAVNRMIKNKEIKSLTDEQHEALENLCSVRHDFHSNMHSVVINDDNNYLKDLLKANQQLRESGLEPINSFPSSLEDYIDIDSIPLLIELDENPDHDDTDEYNKWYDEEYQRIYEELSELHSSIEEYLRDIDRKHGTNYAPSGSTRIY